MASTDASRVLTSNGARWTAKARERATKRREFRRSGRFFQSEESSTSSRARRVSSRAIGRSRDPFEEFAEMERAMEREFERATGWWMRDGRDGRGGGGSRRRTPGGSERVIVAPRDDWRREESGERRLPGGGTHTYYVSERVTTYGTPRADAARGARLGALGSIPSALALGIALGATYAYVAFAKEFVDGFDATTYRAERRNGLALRWPLLYASNEKFRSEFDRARSRARAARSTAAFVETKPSTPNDDAATTETSE